jgi:hypothetical protein
MDGLEYVRDIRETEPDAYHQTAFRRGWHEANAVPAHNYQPNALKELTWQNLGWRLGKLLGQTSDETINEFYDLSVKQLKEKLAQVENAAVQA